MKKAGFYLFYGLLGTTAAFVSAAMLTRVARCCRMWAAYCCGGNQPQDSSVQKSDIESHDAEINLGKTSADEVQRKVQFIGNPRTRKFHLLTCHTAPETQDSVLFETQQEALMNEYVPCGICKP